MKEKQAWRIFATVLLIVFTASYFSRSAYAQVDYEASQRGIFGDVLDTANLHGLVENMYSFRDSVLRGEGPDSELLKWLIPHYRGFSRTIMGSLFWPLKFFFLPIALIVSSFLPLYQQIGLVGVALASGFLTGMVYMLPLFLLIEVFSKTGLVAMHGKTMLKLLTVFFLVSAILLLIAYGYPNALLLFSSYLVLIATLWFAWFLPIVLYYES